MVLDEVGIWFVVLAVSVAVFALCLITFNSMLLCW
jgi:hypothetical protein